MFDPSQRPDTVIMAGGSCQIALTQMYKIE